MLTTRFATYDLPKCDQFDSWRDWYRTVFEITTDAETSGGFEAANSNWIVGGLTISEVASPSVAVARNRSFVRRNPVDHWVLTLSNHSASDVATRDRRFRVVPGVPFLLSLGEEMSIRREVGESRMQILLSRDAFASSMPRLDAAVGIPLDGPRAALLADFLRMVKASAPTLSTDEASRLKGAVQAMLEACLAPSGSRVETAERPIAGHSDGAGAQSSGPSSVLAVTRHREALSGGSDLAVATLPPVREPGWGRPIHPAPPPERELLRAVCHLARPFHRTRCRDVMLRRRLGLQQGFSPRVRHHAQGGASGRLERAFAFAARPGRPRSQSVS